ncbi:MAG: thioesterase family protein [Chloroflexota bacterium]
MTEEEKEQLLRTAAEQFIPFNKHLGIQYHHGDPIQLSLNNRPELVGNAVRNILHGGVIATILDVAGGIAIMKNMVDTLEFETQQGMIDQFARSGTVDLRVDYLRPGRGQTFTATGEIIRDGKRITVTRMQLQNEEGTLIAVGTGTYVV